jgi:hypothetical protein
VYAAMMVLGLAVVGWFFIQPHAEVAVTDSGNGDFVVNAAPGTGYGYRWYPDAKGAAQNEKFGVQDTLKVHLDEGTTKTVKVEVRNAFSDALDLPVVRWVFPPKPVKEVTLTRPKIEKPVKLELGER